MDTTPLIITGFHANLENWKRKRAFLDLWIANTGDHNVVIIDNNEVEPLKLDNPKIRVVRLNHNIGRWDAFWGSPTPFFCGWSVAWIIGGMIAYSEQRDMIFKEQDCLWFGDCVGELYRKLSHHPDIVAQIGFCPKAPCCVESALFWVRKEYIIEMIGKYFGVPKGDGLITVEEKFHYLSIREKRIVPVSFGVGRDRPMPIRGKVWYIQKTTERDLAKLRKAKLI